MSKSIIEIRRKSDGKILRDEINDACQTHNIYDGDVLVESNKDYNIGYLKGVGFFDFSKYEELADYEEQPMMTQEATIKCWVADDKDSKRQILLKYLCAMLPYGVKGKVETTDGNGKEIKDEGVLNSVYINEYGCVFICIEGMEYELDDFKLYLLYLRPMTSMTEEERKEFIHYAKYEVEESVNGRHYEYYLKDFVGTKEEHIANADAIDWLNKHKFDYRNLIPRGLALPAPERMYK